MAHVVEALPAEAATAATDRVYRLLGNLVLALAIVGFPLAAALSEILAYTTNTLSIGYRVVNSVLCLLLLLWTLARGAFRMDLLAGAFLALYATRLLLDLNYSMLPDIAENALFFVVAVLIPTLGVAGGRAWYDEKTCLRFILVIGGIGSALIAYADLAMGISVAGVDTDRVTLSFLNPISIGYHGLFTAAAGIMLIARHRSAGWMIPCILVVLLGGFLLVVSGSRGPFVALLAALLVTGAANRRANAAYFLGGIIVVGLVAYFGVPEAILNRFRGVGTDVSSAMRIYAIQLSIDAALEHPAFGYAYIEPVTGLYPHNLLLESALALGLIGFVLMLWMQFALVWNAWRLARAGAWFLPFMASAMLANAWISGSLWGSGLFFVALWLVRDHRPLLLGARRIETPAIPFGAGG
jgi:O-antigen ligase